MEKYYLICEKRIVKGIFPDDKTGGFVRQAFEYKNNSWVEISINDINDRLIGYDPTEDDFYAIGNTEIMDELREMTDEERELLLTK